MNYAKVIILISVMSFLLSLSSLALDNNSYKNNTSSIYISGQYKPSIPQFNKFSIKEAYTGTKIPKSLKQGIESVTFEALKSSDNFTLPYNPTYKKNLLGLGGTIGYAIDNFRIEFETFYERFNVNTPSGYIYDKIYEYFNIELGNKQHYYTMRNSGITLSPALINVCYDVTKKKFRSISPYLCLGVGADFIDFLDKVSLKFSYQAKVGISYLMSPNLVFFIDGSFHGHLGNQFSDLVLDYPASSKIFTPFTSASVKFNINFLTTSIGIKFIF